MAESVDLLSSTVLYQGELEAARRLAERALVLYRELGIYDPTSRSCSLYFPGLETMKDVPAS